MDLSAALPALATSPSQLVRLLLCDAVLVAADVRAHGLVRRRAPPPSGPGPAAGSQPEDADLRQGGVAAMAAPRPTRSRHRVESRAEGRCARCSLAEGRRCRHARDRIKRRAGWVASWRLGSGGEGERGEPVLVCVFCVFFSHFEKDRGLNTVNYRYLFAKFLNETFSHLRKDCGLNTKKQRDFSAKLPRR